MKTLRIIYKSMMYSAIFFLVSILSTSCEDYLDKAPEVDISEKDIFTKFNTFQGYLENLYQCVIDVTLGTHAYTNFNWSDDVINTQSQGNCEHFDKGNYLRWTAYTLSPFAGRPTENMLNNAAKSNKGYWHNGWLGIRIANICLSHLKDLSAGTQEERDIIEGQAYFFRAYLHYEILRAWGGIPYIDTFLAPDMEFLQPRLSYHETADKIAADLERAAAKLPVSWDLTVIGKVTEGANNGRVTKAAAYGYLGKNYLDAASPLMNGVVTGTYDYNIEYCKKAAKALNEVIKISAQFPQYVGLETWDDYFKNFYTMIGEVPLGKEIIFNNPIYLHKRNDYMEHMLQALGGYGCFSSPTENYVRNFGMANGLPIDETDSGYDPNDRWVNRDPRFYYNIQIDGERQVLLNNIHSFAEYFTGGLHRNTTNSTTGYGYKKYKHITCNKFDNKWGNLYFAECPQMRFADVYLMYAEAVNEAYGPNTIPPDISGGLTAVQALNIVRNRANVPDVDSRFYASNDKLIFREIIRKERAVELAFENHRWYDVRRWYVGTDLKYRQKIALDFPKDHSFINEYVYRTIVFEEKHYWLPFPVAQVSLYPEWPQNPGW